MDQEIKNSKGQFKSNFGFLMAALGSAVGLGNLWSFPYKLGAGGGFSFLLIYIILAVFVGYPLIITEIGIGRKTKKGAIKGFEKLNPRFKFNGVLQTIVPFFLICFYCTFGGYILKYLVASIVDILESSAVIRVVGAGEFFENTLNNVGFGIMWMGIFLLVTLIIVAAGVSGGIERFCSFAMPALLVMMVVVAVRSCTLEGAEKGIKFLFNPDFSRWSTAEGFLNDFKLAGGQMFFSLSLCSGSILAYGSYLSKDEDLEKDAIAIVLGDSLVAIIASLAIMPAVFAFGMEPTGGPGLLFVSMTAVFQSMGIAGRFFQFIFWLLVLFSAISSSIAMMEGGVSSIIDVRLEKGKTSSRLKVVLGMGIVAFLGNVMTTADALGNGTMVRWFHILGQDSVLNVWDSIGEGLLMPLTGLIMAILLGWINKGYLDDEIRTGSAFKTRGMYNFCIRWLGPIFMAFIVFGQIMSFWG